MFENDKCKKDFWELLSDSDIAYTFYVLKNNSAVWEQVKKYHADNTGICQEDKVKFNLCKSMTKKEIDKEEINEDDKKKLIAVKGSTLVGLRKS